MQYSLWGQTRESTVSSCIRFGKPPNELKIKQSVILMRGKHFSKENEELNTILKSFTIEVTCTRIHWT